MQSEMKSKVYRRFASQLFHTNPGVSPTSWLYRLSLAYFSLLFLWMLHYFVHRNALSIKEMESSPLSSSQIWCFDPFLQSKDVHVNFHHWKVPILTNNFRRKVPSLSLSNRQWKETRATLNQFCGRQVPFWQALGSSLLNIEDHWITFSESPKKLPSVTREKYIN